ncbi:hypothetical protein MgSA37_00980 [Mucilaginibacter gotjawali]|uniref:Uncharacterized protein n=1 Tax=Mucilaginibacter gotjawali TaxID=1550579 RepID=A0A110B1F8_9SPHI|nr:hypothetical protein MgSA37_00980 [Mucilaginibacter gotjawali]
MTPANITLITNVVVLPVFEFASDELVQKE